MEVARYGVQVACICPGITNTAMPRRLVKDEVVNSATSPEDVARYSMIRVTRAHDRFFDYADILPAVPAYLFDVALIHRLCHFSLRFSHHCHLVAFCWLASHSQGFDDVDLQRTRRILSQGTSSNGADC